MTAGAQPPYDLSDSLLGWAHSANINLAATLSGVDAVYEANIAPDEMELYERFTGIFLRRQLRAGGSFDALIDLIPALMTVVLTHRAARIVDPHNLPAEALAGMGLDTSVAGKDAEEVLAAAVSRVLDAVGLFSTLETAAADAAPVAAGEVGLPEHMVVLGAHAGVVECDIPDVIELIDTTGGADAAYTAITQGTAAEHFGEEHEQRIAAPLTVTTAVATVRPVATKALIEGIADLVAASVNHPETPLAQLPHTLPVSVREHTLAEIHERPAGTPGRRFAVGTATRERAPRIIFDSVREKVCVRLPELPLKDAAQQRTWRVNVDGTTSVYRTGKPWGEVNLLSQSIDIPVTTPVKEVTVTDADTGTQWVVPVVADHEDPALIFTVKGQHLSDKRSVHHAAVTVIAPSNARMVDVVRGEDLTVTSRSQVGGWDGWEASHVDCSDAVSLQVVPHGGKDGFHLPVRCVDARRRVRFVDPSAPVMGLRSVTRLPIHDASLIAEFPPTVTGEEETWYLTISSFAGAGNSGEEVAPAEPLIVPAEGGVFDIFDPSLYDAPWVGEYLVRLRGPRNESFRHEYAIVEGITVDYDIAGLSKAFRIPAQGGLSEVTLSVRPSTKPFTVEPRPITVGGQAPGAEFVVTTDEGDQMPVWFKPPRLRFDIPLLGQPSRWRTTRLVAGTRSFDPAGLLRVRVAGMPGALKDAKVSVRNHHGTPLRTVNMQAEDPVTMVAPCQPLVSAMGSMAQGRLDVEWTDVQADKRVSVNLATITNVADATGATISEDGSTITLAGVPEDRALGAWLWPLTAPWAPGVRVSVDGDSITVPESLRDAGSLSLQLFTADPFSSMRAPLTPSQAAFVLERPGVYRDQDPAKTQLAEFFAGQSETVPDDQALWPLLWDFVTGPSVASATATLARQALAAHPRGALSGLSASEVPAQQQPGELIRAGLVTSDFASPNPTADAEQAHRTAWIGALGRLADLVGIAWPAPAEADTDAEGEEQAEDTAAGTAARGEMDRVGLRKALDALAAVAGDTVVSTVRTGRDTTLETACIDASTVAIAGMPPAQQEQLLAMFFDQARIVPGPIMDDSARLLAVFEAFNKREEVSTLLGDEELIQAAVSLLRGMRGANKQLFSAARIRFDKLDGVDTDDPANRWALAPVISIVFALSARMHAHGLMGKSKTLAAATPGWAKLAELVPDLVTGDIISAEAMVLAVMNPQLGS